MNKFSKLEFTSGRTGIGYQAVLEEEDTDVVRVFDEEGREIPNYPPYECHIVEDDTEIPFEEVTLLPRTIRLKTLSERIEHAYLSLDQRKRIEAIISEK